LVLFYWYWLLKTQTLLCSCNVYLSLVGSGRKTETKHTESISLTNYFYNFGPSN